MLSLEDQVLIKEQSQKHLANSKAGFIIIEIKFYARNMEVWMENQSKAARARIRFSFWSSSLMPTSRSQTAKCAEPGCREGRMEQNCVQKDNSVLLIGTGRLLGTKGSKKAWRMLMSNIQFGSIRLSSTQARLFLNQVWHRICFSWLVYYLGGMIKDSWKDGKPSDGKAFAGPQKGGHVASMGETITTNMFSGPGRVLLQRLKWSWVFANSYMSNCQETESAPCSRKQSARGKIIFFFAF
jgi:hypothetical protein